MTDLPPLLLARDRVRHGLTPNQLAKDVKAGALVRIRHGVYIDGPAWRLLKPWERYRLQVQAAAETFEKPTVFARHSAASVWGIPTIGVHPVQALTLKNDGGRSRSGVVRHYAAPAGLSVVRREGLLVTGRLRTILDLAAFTPFLESVAPLDYAVHPDRDHDFPAFTKAELEAGIGTNYSAAAARRILAAVAFADQLSGSAGESYSRALIEMAGFEAPILQFPIRDHEGLVGYADFYWKQAKVAGEFDGVQKYAKAEFLEGRTVTQVVVSEKNRENRIRATGTHVVRWDWADLMEPGKLARMLAAAGVPRRRTRSAP